VPTHLKLHRLSWPAEVGVGQDEGYMNDLHWSVSTLFLLFSEEHNRIFWKGGGGKKMVLILNDFYILSKWSFKSPHKNISCQRKWSVSSSM